jgi:AraC-like DNA-binding protein
VEPDALLREHAIDRSLVNDPEARIPFRKYAAIFEAAAEISGDDCFGLHLGAKAEPQMFDVLGYAVMSCPTLEAALNTACRYTRLLDGGEMRLDVDDDFARLHFRITEPEVGPCRQVTEDKGAHLSQVVRAIASNEWHPVEVRFKHPAPTDSAEHRRFFRCPVLFGQARNALSFDAALLKDSLATADERLLHIMVRVIEKALCELPDPDEFLHAVRKIVVDNLPHGATSLADIARRLGMSSRTLQRRCADYGVTYHRLLNQTRHRLSLSYLRRPELAISEIAFLLGYTDVSAFSRAFVRWTALTPGDYRRASMD